MQESIDSASRDPRSLGSKVHVLARITRATVLSGLLGASLAHGQIDPISTLFMAPSANLMLPSDGFTRFGRALAVGDFDGNRLDDPAIGAPDTTIGLADEAGAVHVLEGSGVGLTETGSWFLNREPPPPTAQMPKRSGPQVRGGVTSSGFGSSGDALGSSLVVGDFNEDQLMDLAIGGAFDNVAVPGEFNVDQGSVNVIYSTLGVGPSPVGDVFLHTNLGFLSAGEEDQRFGARLAAGSFRGQDGDGLIIGAPGATVEGLDDVGAVFVFPSSDAGLTLIGAQLWSTGSPGTLGEPTVNEKIRTSCAFRAFHRSA